MRKKGSFAGDVSTVVRFESLTAHLATIGVCERACLSLCSITDLCIFRFGNVFIQHSELKLNDDLSRWA